MKWTQSYVTALSALLVSVKRVLGVHDIDTVSGTKLNNWYETRELIVEPLAPTVIGQHYEITISSLSSESEIKPETTQRQKNNNGFSYKLTHEGASYISAHFAFMDLPKLCVMEITDGGRSSSQGYKMHGRGKMDLGTFWAEHVKGDTMEITLKCDDDHGEIEKNPPVFLIDEYAAGFPTTSAITPEPEAICGEDENRNAICFNISHHMEYEKSRAVARILLNGSSFCTGWLASDENHLITNAHCIRTQNAAQNSDYQFMAEHTNCTTPTCPLCDDYDGGLVISGGTLLVVNDRYDYAVIHLNGNLSAYGYLEMDNREVVLGEEIYIPQHPQGKAKQIGLFDSTPGGTGVCMVSGFEPQCQGYDYLDVGYFCDTDGGSSGSPVISRTTHKVIALHHCANCPNRGVPIFQFYNEIAPYIDPALSLPPSSAPTMFECDKTILRLELLTDNFGRETTWDLKDANDTIIRTGGPYEKNDEIEERLCLVNTGCYTFTIKDSIGDGICCRFGNGYYKLHFDGEQIITGSEFGTDESIAFGLDCVNPPSASPTISNQPSISLVPTRVPSLHPTAGPTSSAAPSGSCPSNCFQDRFNAGCDVPTCENIVCAQDSFCCTGQWDEVCASTALVGCVDLLSRCPV